MRGQPTLSGPRVRRWLSRAIAALALSTGFAACGHVPATDPFGAPAESGALDSALAHASPGCRELLRIAFVRGDRPEGCVEDRRAVGRSLAKLTNHEFGFVDQRTVDLRGLSLIAVRARGCQEWPLRAPGYAVLTRPDIQAAGCRFDRYTGPLEVTAFETDGTSYPGIISLQATDGVVRFSFAEADAVVRVHGFSGLDAFEGLQIGRDGWAGTINLRRLRDFTAIWHFVWVVRGRGAPALFAALHPEHPRSGDARALGVEATLSRQERDYLAVARGELSPRRFLDRYVWSPFRRSVAAMAGAPPVASPEVAIQRTSRVDEPTVTADPGP